MVEAISPSAPGKYKTLLFVFEQVMCYKDCITVNAKCTNYCKISSSLVIMNE